MLGFINFGSPAGQIAIMAAHTIYQCATWVSPPPGCRRFTGMKTRGVFALRFAVQATQDRL